MKVLVTGGAGFIGSQFVRTLLSLYPDSRITVLDILSYAGNLSSLEEVLKDSRVDFKKGDVRKPEDVAEAIDGCESVVHFAAETHVDRSILNSSDFVTTDVYGTYVCLEAAKKQGVKRFIHISTDEVYGEASEKPCKEDAPFFPKSPYAASKAGADRLAFSYYASFGLPVVITRCTNNYGPRQFPEKMIPLFITNALENIPLPLYGDGKNEREWIYVEDHCLALLELLRAEGIEGKAFNIGSGQIVPNIEIVKKMLSALGKPQDLIRFVPDRPGHVRRHAVDSALFSKTFSWKPETSFEEGLRRTLEWYMQNEAWWKKIKHENEEYRAFHKAWYEERK